MQNRKYLTESARITDAYSAMYEKSKKQINESVSTDSLHKSLQCGDLSIEGKGSSRTGSKLGHRPLMRFEKRDVKNTCGHTIPMKRTFGFGKVTSVQTDGEGSPKTGSKLGVRKVLPFEKRDIESTKIGRISNIQKVGCVKGIKESSDEVDTEEVDIDITSDSSSESTCCETCKGVLELTLDAFEQIYDNLSDDDKDLVDELKVEIEKVLKPEEEGEGEEEEDDVENDDNIKESIVSVVSHVLNEGASKAASKVVSKAASRGASKAASKAASRGTSKAASRGTSKAAPKTRRTPNKKISLNPSEPEAAAQTLAKEMEKATSIANASKRAAAVERVQKAAERYANNLPPDKLKIFQKATDKLSKGKSGFFKKAWDKIKGGKTLAKTAVGGAVAGGFITNAFNDGASGKAQVNTDRSGEDSREVQSVAIGDKELDGLRDLLKENPELARTLVKAGITDSALYDAYYKRRYGYSSRGDNIGTDIGGIIGGLIGNLGGGIGTGLGDLVGNTGEGIGRGLSGIATGVSDVLRTPFKDLKGDRSTPKQTPQVIEDPTKSTTGKTVVVQSQDSDSVDATTEDGESDKKSAPTQSGTETPGWSWDDASAKLAEEELRKERILAEKEAEKKMREEAEAKQKEEEKEEEDSTEEPLTPAQEKAFSSGAGPLSKEAAEAEFSDKKEDATAVDATSK